MKRLNLVIALLAFFCFAGNANATTTLAGYDFDDDAFADALRSSYGTFSTNGGSLESVLTDISLGTYAWSWTTGAYVELDFTDNTLVNDTGYDLALFELGYANSFKLTIDDTTITYGSSYTGYKVKKVNVNVALIDLDDFGLAPGTGLSSILVGLDLVAGGQATTFSLAGALNSGPPLPPLPFRARSGFWAQALSGFWA